MPAAPKGAVKPAATEVSSNSIGPWTLMPLMAKSTFVSIAQKHADLQVQFLNGSGNASFSSPTKESSSFVRVKEINLSPFRSASATAVGTRSCGSSLATKNGLGKICRCRHGWSDGGGILRRLLYTTRRVYPEYYYKQRSTTTKRKKKDDYHDPTIESVYFCE